MKASYVQEHIIFGLECTEICTCTVYQIFIGLCEINSMLKGNFSVVIWHECKKKKKPNKKQKSTIVRFTVFTVCPKSLTEVWLDKCKQTNGGQKVHNTGIH